MTECRGNLQIISKLANSGRISHDTAATLSRTLRLYLAQGNARKLSRREARLPAEAFEPEREAIGRLWRCYLEPDRP